METINKLKLKEILGNILESMQDAKDELIALDGAMGSEDLERFYFQYQTEALPHGESLQSFCVKNKVPYNIFQKWYRDTRKKVVEVQVDGAPVIGHEEQSGAIDQPQPVSPGRTDHPVRIWVEIRISNGLHLFQKNLSYPDLVRMVEKLEGLC